MTGKIPNVSQHGYSSFRTDMFGRIKISEGYSLFDSSHRYSQNGDFSDITETGATVTHLINESTAALNVTTTSGSKVYRETKKVFPYQPGKSLQVLQTFVFAPPKTNLRQRAGYFSRQNGFYLEQDGTNVYFVKRSYVTGSVVETRIPQSEWNVDTLDGNGPSDIVLDLTKAQILFSEYEWLGVGSVRLGFAIDGYFIIAHQFNHANLISSVYITTASLPVRYEIENTGTTASASTLKQVCISVISNGGYFKSTNTRSVIRPDTTIATTLYPLIAVRMASGKTDSVIVPSLFALFPTTADDYEYSVTRNPTSITGGSWETHASGNVEYNISATAMVGGERLLEGFFSSTNQSSVTEKSDTVNLALQLGRTNADTPVSDILVLSAKVVAGTGGVKSSLGWFDLL
jgi:hypothetical protein